MAMSRYVRGVGPRPGPAKTLRGRPLIYWQPVAAAGVLTVACAVTLALTIPRRQASAGSHAVAAAAAAAKIQSAPIPKAQPVKTGKPASPLEMAAAIKPEPAAPAIIILSPAISGAEPVLVAELEPPQPPPMIVKIKPEPVVAVVEKPVPPRKPEFPEPKPGCENHGTFVHFVRNPEEAKRLAKAENKLAFILHVSGNFEDEAFT